MDQSSNRESLQIVQIETNLPEPQQITQFSTVKLSALYKPLLRRFRAHFRAKFDEFHNKKLCQHWANERYLKEVRAFMVKGLVLPDALQDNDSTIKMVTLLFPCTIRKLFDIPLQQMDERTRTFFVQVFKENSVAQRRKFFSDPLIQYLW